MTLEDIEAMTKPMLLANEVAQVTGQDPNAIRYMARERPELLGYPVTCYQNEGKVTWHVKIPRLAFLRWMRGEIPMYAKNEVEEYI